MQTVKQLIRAVRSIADETDEANLDDKEDILPALQRGYDHAINVISRHYVDALLAYSTVLSDPTNPNKMYPIPLDAFEERMLKLEVEYGNAFIEITRLNYSDITAFSTKTKAAFSSYYTIIGKKFKLTPPPSSAHPMRLWYAKHPGPLQIEQGTVTNIDASFVYETGGGSYLVVDSVGTDLSTNQSDLTSFVNIVAPSGEIRGTLQIQSIIGNRITFKSVPSRTTVFGRTVLSSLPPEVEKDDYLCYAEGSVIPIIQHSVSNFLIQYAVLDVTRKLGLDPAADKAMKDELSNNLEKLSFGREPDTRIKKRNKSWNSTSRRGGWWGNDGG